MLRSVGRTGRGRGRELRGWRVGEVRRGVRGRVRAVPACGRKARSVLNHSGISSPPSNACLRKRYRPTAALMPVRDEKIKNWPPRGDSETTLMRNRRLGDPATGGTTLRTGGPAHESGKRARKPFGPDPSRRRRARNSVVYWAPGPVPGPTPRPVGVPRLDGPTALHLAVWTKPRSVTDAGSGDVRDGQPAKSRAGLRSKLPTPPQMSTVSRSAETSSFRR
jgi:hypothetical protein